MTESLFLLTVQLIRYGSPTIAPLPPTAEGEQRMFCSGPKHYFNRHDPQSYLAQSGEQSQPSPKIFVPLNILFIFDPEMSPEARRTVEPMLKRVNEKMSKIVMAPALREVRYRSYCSGDPTSPCIRCHPYLIIPEEYTFPCACPDAPFDNPTQLIKQYNKANYTQTVFVVVKGEGSAKDQGFQEWCGQSNLAVAGGCDFDRESRPTHGFIAYCRSPIGKPDDILFPTTLHETLHVLLTDLTGATDPANNCPERTPPGQPHRPFVERVRACGHIFREITYDRVTKDGQTHKFVRYLATHARLKIAAADHFSCGNAEGAEVASRFSMVRGNANSPPTPTFTLDEAHWSELLFSDEILSPSFSLDGSKLSLLTLSALAAHPSFYKVNLSYAESLVLSKPSRELGCKVSTDGCYEVIQAHVATAKDEPQNIAPYCDDRPIADRLITNLCTDDQKRRLTCKVQEECSVRSSGDSFYDDWDCTKTTMLDTSTYSLHAMLGAHYGPQSICLTAAKMSVDPGKSISICALHECRPAARTILLKLQPVSDPRLPPAQPGECNIECRADQSNKIVDFPRVAACDGGNGQPISFVCPDYYRVCEPPTTTSTTSTEPPPPPPESTAPVAPPQTPPPTTPSSPQPPDRDHSSATAAPATPATDGSPDSEGSTSGGAPTNAVALVLVAMMAA